MTRIGVVVFPGSNCDRDTLRVIERESGLEGLLLRPLSAQHFEPTIPELEGWV
jgi:phosphoribosylformylglycinamidine (FGAM) synthase-like amidotransferase family enzyme